MANGAHRALAIWPKLSRLPLGPMANRHSGWLAGSWLRAGCKPGGWGADGTWCLHTMGPQTIFAAQRLLPLQTIFASPAFTTATKSLFFL